MKRIYVCDNFNVHLVHFHPSYHRAYAAKNVFSDIGIPVEEIPGFLRLVKMNIDHSANGPRYQTHQVLNLIFNSPVLYIRVICLFESQVYQFYFASSAFSAFSF